MKIVRFAAGFAAGYVLGSKAGREKYEQIAAAARRLRSNPAVQQAGQKAKDTAKGAVTTGVDTVKAKTDRRHPRPVKPVEPVAPVDLTSPV